MALAKPTFRADYANSRQLSPLETFARASTAMRINKLGALVQAAANQPRFDFDPSTLACKGLLIEPAATNLLTQSEFANGVSDAPVRGGTVVAAAFPGYAGGLAIAADGAVTGFAYKPATVTGGATYSLSVLFRMDDGAAPAFGSASIPAAQNDCYLVVAGVNVAPNTYTVVNMGGGLYRVSASAVAGSSGSANSGVAKNAGNSSRTFKVTGYQLETGGVVTSYIPTAGATATRVADSLSVSGADFARIWRADEWAIAVEGVLPASLPVTGNRHLLYLGEGGSNRIAVAYNHATGRVEVAILQGGVVLVNQAVGPVIAAGQSVRVGVSCKTGSAFLVAVNGTSYAGAVVPAALSANTLALGTYLLTQLHWGGPIVRAEMHARYATLDELIEVTR